jgi:hypothetical protein
MSELVHLLSSCISDTTNISHNAKDIENIELLLRSFEKINISVPALIFLNLSVVLCCVVLCCDYVI